MTAAADSLERFVEARLDGPGAIALVREMVIELAQQVAQQPIAADPCDVHAQGRA